MRFSSVLLFVFWFSYKHAFSQNINIGGVFPTIDHSASFNKKVNYGIYYFAAFPLINYDKPDIKKDTYFHLFYAEHALTFSPSNGLSFTGSYVYQRANVVYDNYSNENRFYFQGKFNQFIKALSLSHRIRFDGRFIEDRSTNKRPFTHRVRYFIGATYPINNNTYLTGYEELFFNTAKSPIFKYEENWAYAGFGRSLNKNNKLEFGLLYVTWDIGNKNWFNQYYFQLTWINQIKLTKD
ncbi:MAG: DUF2490 domain-containing protein [Sphingobacteriaceae bacterium]|jgi:hypothetical protein